MPNSSENTERLLEAAKSLETQMAALVEEFNQVRTFGMRTRDIVRGLVALGVVTAVAVAGVIVALARSEHAESNASVARQAAVASCEATNEVRALQRQLWGYVLDERLRDDPDRNPERLQRIEEFRDYVMQTFAPRDCSTAGLVGSAATGVQSPGPA